jgi:hypothetical protein
MHKTANIHKIIFLTKLYFHKHCDRKYSIDKTIVAPHFQLGAALARWG